MQGSVFRLLSCKYRWISEEVRALSAEDSDCRRAERKWRKDSITSMNFLGTYIMYNTGIMYNEAMKNARREFYFDNIYSASGDQHILLKTLSSLLDSGGSENCMESSVENCVHFCVFFMDKVESIRSYLMEYSGCTPPTLPTPLAKRSFFSLASLVESEQLVSRLKPAGSSHGI